MDKLIEALDMARHLMDDDPTTFKQGYTFINAMLTVVERYNLTADEAASVARMLTKATA